MIFKNILRNKVFTKDKSSLKGVSLILPRKLMSFRIGSRAAKLPWEASRGGTKVSGLRASGFRVEGLGFRAYRVESLGFRVEGLGLRVEGLGLEFRV